MLSCEAGQPAAPSCEAESNATHAPGTRHFCCRVVCHLIRPIQWPVHMYAGRADALARVTRRMVLHSLFNEAAHLSAALSALSVRLGHTRMLAQVHHTSRQLNCCLMPCLHCRRPKHRMQHAETGANAVAGPRITPGPPHGLSSVELAASRCVQRHCLPPAQPASA